MNLDTPLVEVVSHLPKSVALMLHGKLPEVQRAALEYIRLAVCSLEAKGVHLDPIAYEVVLENLGQLAALLAEADELLQRSSAILAEAAALIPVPKEAQ